MFNPKIVRLLVPFFILIIANNARAQMPANSLYTQFGIGDLQSTAFAKNAGFGGLTAAISLGNSINVGNPASYSSIVLTTFETGAISSFESFRTSLTSSTPAYSNVTSYRYIALAFPVYKKIGWSSSLGVLPYSNVGYSYKYTEVLPVGSGLHTYLGNGSLNRFYLGNAFVPVKGLSVGFNVCYLFGNIEKMKFIEMTPSTSYGVSQVNRTAFGDVYFDYGVNYTHKVNETYSLTYGLSGAAKSVQSISSKDYFIRLKTNADRSYEQLDTSATNLQKGEMIIPGSLTAGVVLKKTDKWMIGVDYHTQAWSEFSKLGKSDILSNTSKLILGGEFIPKRWHYRVGLRQEKLYYNVYGVQLQETALSVGLGIPMSRGWSFLNISAEVAERGSLSNFLILEQYARITLGLTLSDRWFDKRKFD